MLPIVLVTALVAALASPAPHDGRHDFDFEIGTWKMAPSGNLHVVRKLWDGATIAQLIVLTPTRHVRGSLLSVYDPRHDVWNIYWADAADGSLSAPLSGAFHDAVGTFIGPDSGGSKRVLTRVVYDRITNQSFRTVQSRSTDGGHSWDVVATWTYRRVDRP